MSRYFTKTFYKFFFGFLAILAVAFGVIITASAVAPHPVDTTAHPE